jgi:hypothetical protein
VWKKIITSFFLGVVISIGILLWISSSSNTKLSADLSASKWSLESATRTNTELALGLRSVSGKLIESNKIINNQQSIIDGQQSELNKQKLIIDGQQSIIEQIIISINGKGNDIRAKIRAIADGFRLLYNYYK